MPAAQFALVGREGFERRVAWLVCVLTGCTIDAERYDQDVMAYLRANYEATEWGANADQIEEAEREIERSYRDLFEIVIEHRDRQCACGAVLLGNVLPSTFYLCPACRIMVPAELLETVQKG
jgi:hypothetical protein